MKFLDHNAHTKKLIELIFQDTQNICLAVAFWGLGSSDLIKKAKNKKIKIICNLESGATNPYEIIKIGQLIGFKNIKSIENLHAKVYCTDKKLILGSSNFSANGLSLEGDETNKLIEANILIEDSSIISQIHKWFDALWASAREVDKDYCRKSLSKWIKNRNRNGKRIKDIDFFKAFESGAYNEEKIYIVIDTIGFTKEEEKEGDKVAKDAIKGDLFYEGKELSYWYDYESVPRDAFIISYFYDDKGKLGYYGIWKTLPKKYDRKGWQFCYEIDYKVLEKKHINQITRVLKQNINTFKITDEGLEMKLSSFYKKFSPSMATESINISTIEKYFKEGDVITSGGRKSKIRIKEILEHGIRFQSVTSPNYKGLLRYDKLNIVLKNFNMIPTNRIEQNVFFLLRANGLSDSTHETNLYGFGKEFIKRSKS